MERHRDTIWNRTFICIMINQFFLFMAISITGPLASSYAAFLGAGAVLAGLLTGLYFGVSVAVRPFSGPAALRFDRKKMLIIANLLGISANILYGVFNDIPMFIAARVLQGIEFSILGTLVNTLLGDSLPKNKLGLGLGIFGISTLIPTAVGAALGLLIKTWGEASFGLLGGYNAVFYSAAVFSALGTIPCFYIKTGRYSDKEIKSAGAWYKNIIALPAVLPSICYMLAIMSNALFSAYLVPYEAEKGLEGISVFFVVYALTQIVLRPMFGRLVDKFGGMTVFIPCIVFFAVSFVLLWMAQNIAVVYISAFFAGLGYGGAYPAIHAVCLQAIPPIKRGAASNTNFLGVDLGMFLGPVLGGVVVSWYSGSGQAYSITYLYALIPLALSMLLTLMFKKNIERSIKKVAETEQ